MLKNYLFQKCQGRRDFASVILSLSVPHKRQTKQATNIMSCVMVLTTTNCYQDMLYIVEATGYSKEWHTIVSLFYLYVFETIPYTDEAYFTCIVLVN